MDQFRNQKFWKKISHRKWEFNGWSELNNMDNSKGIKKEKKIKFSINSKLKYNEKTDNYITVGRGWP